MGFIISQNLAKNWFQPDFDLELFLSRGIRTTVNISGSGRPECPGQNSTNDSRTLQFMKKLSICLIRTFISNKYISKLITSKVGRVSKRYENAPTCSFSRNSSGQIAPD